jgi:hypothetical protein
LKQEAGHPRIPSLARLTVFVNAALFGVDVMICPAVLLVRFSGIPVFCFCPEITQNLLDFHSGIHCASP